MTAALASVTQQPTRAADAVGRGFRALGEGEEAIELVGREALLTDLAADAAVALQTSESRDGNPRADRSPSGPALALLVGDAGVGKSAFAAELARRVAELGNVRLHLAAVPAPERLTFPLLCDPEFAAFRAWRCFDDFEQMPLHGAFLVDAEGRVRWQDIGAEPFMQIDWLLGECRRLLAMPHGGVGSK